MDPLLRLNNGVQESVEGRQIARLESFSLGKRHRKTSTQSAVRTMKFVVGGWGGIIEGKREQGNLGTGEQWCEQGNRGIAGTA
jgi:hypothetical protein